MKKIALCASACFVLLAGSSFGQEVSKSPSTSSESKEQNQKVEKTESLNTETNTIEVRKGNATLETRKPEKQTKSTTKK